MREAERVRTTFLVPIQFVRLLKLAPEVRARHDLSSLELVIHGSAPVAPDVKRAMIEWLGPVLYEFYGGTVDGVLRDMRRAAHGSRVHVLENDEVVLGGVRFLGCCLWTDFDALGAEHRDLHMQQAALVMNDYHHVRTPGGRALTPHDTRLLHAESRAWLRRRLDAPFDGPTVVVTHHAAVRAAFPRWPLKNPAIVSACVSRMEDFMDGSRAALWIHGHTHTAFDYHVHGTRVVCNPRGYPDETSGFDPRCVVCVE